MGNVDQ
jgi:DNA replicative helicase MCM subunit Mcm2 (Cdc46/Mcm family)